MNVIIDIETRSQCDLTKCGAYNYATDPSTEILCIAFCMEGAEGLYLWTPDKGPPYLEMVQSVLLGADKGELLAWNAQFERLVINAVWKLDLKIEQFSCIACQARACDIHGEMGLACRHLSLPVDKSKDYRGRRLIQACCIPDTEGKFQDELLPELYDYCVQDVIAERELHERLPKLSEKAQAEWIVSEKINDRGISCDLGWARQAVRLKDQVDKETRKRVIRLTRSDIKAPSGSKFGQWIYQRIGRSEARELIPLTKKTKAPSFTKDVIQRLFDVHYNWQGEGSFLNTYVIGGLRIMMDAKLSVAQKYENILRRSSSDGRLRGSYILNGASGTGRFSSKGVQMQNLKRGSVDAGGGTTEMLAAKLRSTFIANKGQLLVGCDLSSIEARILPWLCDGFEATGYLNDFRGYDADNSLPDPYECEASRMFRVDPYNVSPEQRQAGKILVLGCGYQASGATVQGIAQSYGIEWSVEEAESHVAGWRARNQWCVSFWNALNTAAMRALENPGWCVDAGRLTFLFEEKFLKMKLPCGRLLYFPYARLAGDGFEYRSAGYRPAADCAWPYKQGYGGLLAAHATQGTAASLLRDKLTQVSAEDLHVVAHVHDSICIECPEGAQTETGQASLLEIMTTPMTWCSDLPLAGETWSAKEFKG